MACCQCICRGIRAVEPMFFPYLIMEVFVEFCYDYHISYWGYFFGGIVL